MPSKSFEERSPLVLYNPQIKNTSIKITSPELLLFKGKITSKDSNNNYFTSKVSFLLDFNNKNYTPSPTSVQVHDINFKNEQHVSLSDRTEDYYYLYDVSECSASRPSSSSSSSSNSVNFKKTEDNIHLMVKNIIYGLTSKYDIINKTVTISIPSPNNNHFKLSLRYIAASTISSFSSDDDDEHKRKFPLLRKIFKISFVAVILVLIGFLLSKNDYVKEIVEKLVDNFKSKKEEKKSEIGDLVAGVKEDVANLKEDVSKLKEDVGKLKGEMIVGSVSTTAPGTVQAAPAEATPAPSGAVAAPVAAPAPAPAPAAVPEGKEKTAQAPAEATPAPSADASKDKSLATDSSKPTSVAQVADGDKNTEKGKVEKVDNDKNALQGKEKKVSTAKEKASAAKSNIVTVVDSLVEDFIGIFN